MGLSADAKPARKGRLLLAVAAAGLAAACVSPPKPDSHAAAPVDPHSPVAREVEAALRNPGPYPRFADIPTTPTDVRPSSAWRAAITEQRQTGKAADADAAAQPATLSDTEAYADQSRGRVAVRPGDVAPADSQAMSEAYAAEQRARATPPPPPK